jgi:hypothetical protein
LVTDDQHFVDLVVALLAQLFKLLQAQALDTIWIALAVLGP